MIEPQFITGRNRLNFVATVIYLMMILFCVNAHAESKAAPASSSVSKSGVTALSASLTSGDNGESGASTAVPDLFTGAFSYKIPIEVPRGRNRMEPKLALTYRSSNGKGWIGSGLELELGSIERSTKPSLDYSADNYLLHRADGTFDLVNVNGEYRFKIERDFFRIRKLTASDGRPYWEVTDKSGKRYLFGESAASRQDDPANPDHIFKWCLDRVVDTNGNYLTLSYSKDQGQIYLDRIDYAGNGTLAPTNYVKFSLESRSDVSVSTTTNFNVSTAYRLKAIGVFANDNQIKKYDLSYAISASSGQSLLTSITESDKDSSNSLPPITLEWQQNPELLSKITNSFGGKTTIGYTPSTSYQNTNLPITVQTVSSISTDDGNGNVATTNYTYSGGYYYSGESDFRGFNYAKVTAPLASNGVQKITETWFHQGNDTAVDVNNPNVAIGYMKGKPYRTRVTNSSGTKYSEVTTSYAACSTAPYFNAPQQVDSYTYDGGTNYKQARTIYTYDSYGNIIREDQYGDLSDGSDDRTAIRGYSPNTSSWIVGLAAEESTYQGIGTTNKVSSKIFYYDDLTDCNATPTNNQTPVKGNLTRVVGWLNGGANPETRLAYDFYGNISCSRNARGGINTLGYDTSFTFPTVITNPLGQQTLAWYYGVNNVPADTGLYGQVRSVQDPNGAVISYQYDTFGRKIKEIMPDNSWTSRTYNNFGTAVSQYVRIDSSEGPWSEKYFDGFGRTVKEKVSGPDAKVIVTDTEYDVTGAVKERSLPYFNGLETPRYQTCIYDVLGRLLQSTVADNTRTLACYNGWVKVTIDPNNHRKRETSDAFGRLVKVEEYTGTYSTCTTDTGVPYATTTYQYDTLGNIRFLTDAKGNQTEIRYDTLGRKTFMHDPDMGEWIYTYDGNGNLISQTDAKGQLIQFAYDTLDRPISKNYPSGVGVTYTYDEPSSTYGKGRLTTMSDASGTTRYFYDALGRTVKTLKTVDGTDYPILAAYDGLDRVKSIIYPDNESVNYSYDAGGNLSQVGNYATYTNYNAFGQPGKLSFGNGISTSYQYYSSNNRINFITTASPTLGNLLNVGYNYDNKGNIGTINDYVNGSRTQNFVYDELDRLTQAQGNYGLVTYSYDQIGNILVKEGIGYSYGSKPHAAITTFSCPSGTVPSVTACTKTTTYAATATTTGGVNYSTPLYKKKGNILGNPTCSVDVGLTTLNDGCGVVGYMGSSSFSGSIPLYKKKGNILGNPTCSVDVGLTTLNDGCGVVGYMGSSSFSGSIPLYKKKGNILGNPTCSVDVGLTTFNDGCGVVGYTAPSQGTYQQTTTYSCNPGDTLNGTTCTHIDNYAATPVTNYAYDANGNMTSDGQRTITFDYDNMPKTINGNISFSYDGSGNRVKKTTGSLTRLYIGDLYECTGGSCVKYIYAGDTKLAFKDATRTYYYHPDHLGSTNIVTDAGGNKVEEITYYPFGKTSSDTGSARVSHLFTSQELDGETSLYNYNARLYNSDLGRFISADSIVPDPTNPQSLNRYSYVLNNPLLYTDPTGHWIDLYNYYYPPSSYGPPSTCSTCGGPPAGTPRPSSPSPPPAPAPAPAPTPPPAGSNFTANNYDPGYNCNDSGWLQDSLAQDVSTASYYAEITFNILNSIKFPLIDNFIEPKPLSEEEMALQFLPVGSVGKIASAAENVVYKGVDKAGVVRYIGITVRNAAERWGEHLNAMGTGKEHLKFYVIDGATRLTRMEARIFEQIQINLHGLQKNGGTLLNKINSISEKFWSQHGILP